MYGPSDVGKYHTDFYKDLTKQIEKSPESAVICGDFNIVTDKLDSKNIENFKLTPAAKVWKIFTDVYKLRDIWRWRNQLKNYV